MASDRRMRLNRQPDASSWPRGVECVMVVDNQYVLNDRRRPGSIFVTGITGLTGADVVVGAEKNADRDGETPNDGTYGGRTVSLKGFVRGGDLEDMRYLYSYLMDAFDDLVERQLWFQWLDWRDTFEDTYALRDYFGDLSFGTLSVAPDGSGLAPSSIITKSLIVNPTAQDGSSPARLSYGDGEVIVQFTCSTSPTGLLIGVEARRSSINQKLTIFYNGSTNQFNIRKLVGGGPTTLVLASGPVLASGSTYWMRVRLEGSDIRYSIWGEYPPDIGGVPLHPEHSYTLSGGDEITFSPTVSGLQWGLYWQPSSVNDRVELLEVGALNKGDGVIYCRKASTIDGEEVQTEAGWKRDFMVTLRASDPRIVSRKVSSVSIVPSGFALMFPRIWSFEGNSYGWASNGFSSTFGAEISSRATDGTYGLRCTGTITNNDGSAFSPTFDVQPGQAWSARCDIYANVPANNPLNYGRIRIQWDDGSNTFALSNTDGADISSGVGAKIATIANAIAPAGATQARLRIVGATTGTSTIDWIIDWVAIAQSAIVPTPAHGDDALFFPADGSGLVFGAPLPNPVVNLGTRGAASMIVRFYGAMTNPVLLDPTTDRSIGIVGTIADGDYVEVNTFRRTAFHSSGASVYSSLTDETSWPEIDGSVTFVLGADSVSGAGRILISYRHSSR